MGQIRKRGTFYQIRYYRHGQLIEETTEHTKWDDARDLLRKRENANVIRADVCRGRGHSANDATKTDGPEVKGGIKCHC